MILTCTYYHLPILALSRAGEVSSCSFMGEQERFPCSLIMTGSNYRPGGEVVRYLSMWDMVYSSASEGINSMSHYEIASMSTHD